METKKLISNGYRDRTIDLLRAIAIILMTLTHTIVFFHNFTNKPIMWFSDLGGDISYTLFLFCFGAGIFYAFLKEPTKEKKLKFLKRAGVVTIIYYILATLGRFALQKSLTAQLFWQIIIFETIVPFTEFFISFAVILVITIAFPKVIRAIAKNVFVLGIFSFSFYLLGMMLLQLAKAPSILGLFAGFADMHYFPILFYIPIYLLGINYAMTKGKENPAVISAMGLILTTIFYFLSKLIGDPIRFPPSIEFIMYGLMWTYGFLFVLNIIDELKSKPLQKVLSFIQPYGARALGIFVIHTLLLFTYDYLWGDKFTKWYIVVPVWIISLVVSAIFKVKL